MEEYGISSSKIREVEQMGIEGALEALNQKNMKALAVPATGDAYSCEVASSSE